MLVEAVPQCLAQAIDSCLHSGKLRFEQCLAVGERGLLALQLAALSLARGEAVAELLHPRVRLLERPLLLLPRAVRLPHALLQRGVPRVQLGPLAAAAAERLLQLHHGAAVLVPHLRAAAQMLDGRMRARQAVGVVLAGVSERGLRRLQALGQRSLLPALRCLVRLKVPALPVMYALCGLELVRLPMGSICNGAVDRIHPLLQRLAERLQGGLVISQHHVGFPEISECCSVPLESTQAAANMLELGMDGSDALSMLCT
mmetsp:Transcript_100456/g.292798  ORF Transcript_100456/g.292798 Transcript_100456/m.292798 type:complete len:258 (-) Transcript_100456:3031-3804(-)